MLGFAFYLMAEVYGINPTSGLTDAHQSAGAQHDMGVSMVDARAARGRVDHRAVGRADFGKPYNYLERQVSRWAAQLENYGRFEDWPGPGSLPQLDDVQLWLTRNRPTTFEPGLIHGDYSLGNVMFAPDGPQVAAIIDWELATIGDPLLDLGWMLATWPGEDEPMETIFTVRPWIGFPGPDELVARYAEGSSRNLSAARWYTVLACYKLGILLEGTYARACAGKAEADLGRRMHEATAALFRRAARTIEG